MNDTRTLYAKLATDRPAKARRYRASITDTLGRENIHPLERERLEQALLGIADVLGQEVLCRRCGAALENDESRARGFGPECAERMAVSA